MNIALTQCRLADQDGLQTITVRDGVIETVGGEPAPPDHFKTVDVGGRLVAPGFIDVHIQGAGGADILDGTPEALATISRTLARLGTTAFLATTLVHGGEENTHLRLAAEATGKPLGGAELLGIHLEGPFINARRRGGISASCIYPPSPQALRQVLSLTGDSLRMMTIAPEPAGNSDLIRELRRRNIVASFGHSDASYEETQAGFAAGIAHVTHLFNAMPPLNHRQPGPLLAIFEDNTVTAQIISDGVHLHPRIVHMAYRWLGPERCVCITDGVQAMGLPEGRYVYNGREYESRDGTARYLDGTLIGSAMPLTQMVKRFQRFTGCSLQQAFDAGSRNPARALGIDDRKGSIGPGKDADVVVLQEDFSVWMTVVAGQIVWRR